MLLNIYFCAFVYFLISVFSNVAVELPKINKSVDGYSKRTS